jgi:hypothetical protein
LLLTAVGGFACHSENDILTKRDGGAGGASGAGMTGVGGLGGAAGSAGGAAAGAGGTDGGGTPGPPIIGMPLATFDTTLDGFILDTDAYSSVIDSSNRNLLNIGGYSTGLPPAELAQDPTAGSPTPGCLKLSAPFVAACCQFVEVMAPVAGPQDWSDRVLHARVRVQSGTFAGVAQLFVSSGGTVADAWSTTSLPSDGDWHELTLDVGQFPPPGSAFDVTHISQLGLQLNSGDDISAPGPVVFQIDSFSLEVRIAPADAATD